MKLYKYVSAELGLKILESGKLRFTQPISFNDPFDSDPLILSLYKDKHLPQLLDKSFQDGKVELEKKFIEIYDEVVGTKNPVLLNKSTAFKVQTVNNLMPSIKKSILDNIDPIQFREQNNNNFLENVKVRTGVLCLSKDPLNLLMWAHYANCHKGFVLEFNSNNPFFNATTNNIYPPLISVKYSKHRPIINTTWYNKKSSQLLKIFQATFFTKSIDWRYENEVRVIRILGDDSFSGKYLYNYPIHLFSFPQESLTAVIIGCHTSKIHQIKLSETLSNYPNGIAIYKAILDKKCYKVNTMQQQ